MSREVRRVPLDFAAPLREVWAGYIRPDSLDGDPCPDCFDPIYRGACDGNTPQARALTAQWYGWAKDCPDAPASWVFEPTMTGSTPHGPDHPAVWAFAQRNVASAPWYYGAGDAAVRREAMRLSIMWDQMWMHHLAPVDVDALIEAGRLRDLTHDYDPAAEPDQRFTPHGRPVLAADVNAWSMRGMGHDSINCWTVVKARAAREGIEVDCPTCEGHGSVERYPGQREAAENWEWTEPPTGEGWQLWETTTEGSPVSPVFATDRELARWLCTETGRCAVGFGGSRVGWDFNGALAFVAQGHSVASMLLIENRDGSGGVMIDGSVAAILDDHGRPPTSQTAVEQLDANGEPVQQ